eukprot:Gb_01786 [translate_table: standard]
MYARRETIASPRPAPPRHGPWHSMAPPFPGGVPVDHGPRLTPRNNHQMKIEEEEAPPSHNLWVGNVSNDTNESALMDVFSKYGEIDSIAAYPQRNYAFVYFKHLDHAKAAKDSLQGVALGGSCLRIEFARAAKPSKHLWVGGISQTVTKEQLEAEFLKFGRIVEIKFLRDRNCAIVDYSNLEDAVSAVKYLNGRQLGVDSLRVDFLRSQPQKRESTVNAQLHAVEARDGHISDQRTFMGTPELLRRPSDTIRISEPPPGLQAKFQSAQGIEGGRKQGCPSKILWIGYPPSVKIDEQRLHNALILFGEIERIKSFPARHYAFVQFRSVDEARRAKDGLQGRLFNDPRIQILFSNSEIGPVDNPKDNTAFITPVRGPPRPEIPYRGGSQFGSMERFGPVCPIDPNNVPGTSMPVRAAGPRGFTQHHAPDGRIPGPGADSFHNFPDVKMNSPRPSGWGKPPPVTAAGLRPVRPPPGVWDGFDASASQRESKRPRVEEAHPTAGVLLDARKPDIDSAGPMFGYYGPQPDRGIPRSINASDDRQIMGQKGNVGSHINGNHQPVVGPGHMAVASSSARTAAIGDQGEHCRGADKNWCWQGTIAKGGTAVCRARCLPVGKGIDAKFPEIVNCSARTGLDMLAKHFSQASDYGLVFFIPEGDQDVPPYTEFLRYLGSKHRAGVAKFSDGTTLFLVPPSDFSEQVLKVPGTDHLFGVVLKFLQPPCDITQQNPSQQHALSHDPAQQYAQRQQFPVSQMDYTKMPPREDSVPRAAGMPQSFSPPKGLHTVQAAAPESTSQVSAPQSAPISLTPELIATLTSLLPNAFQVSGSGSASFAPSSSMRHETFHSSSGYDSSASSMQSSSGVLVEGSSVPDSRSKHPIGTSQVWRQHQQPPPLHSGISYQPRQDQDSHQPRQQHHQYNNRTSFSPVAAGSLSNYNNTLEQNVHGAAASLLFQETSIKMQQSTMVPQTGTTEIARQPSVLAQRKDLPAGQLAVFHAQGHRQQEAPLNSQKSYGHSLMTEASETIQSLVSQQPKPVPAQSSGQSHGGGGAQALSNVQLGHGEMNQELSSQVQQLQGLGAALLGHGQENLESEADKNQRYQSTLQFAANLLLQIQQQQQQANKNATESTQHQQ